MTSILHAGLIARRADGVWRGVLVEGASGAGKSDLMLRALGLGWRLVADDRVVVWGSAGAPYGRAPAALGGLLEARGLGVMPVAPVPFARLALAVSHADSPERLPDPGWRDVAGVRVPAVALNLREESAASKLGHALALALQSDAASQLGVR